MGSADLLARASSGDGAAFGALVEPYRRELQVHCYRLLGSVQDAEDTVQEVLLAAWRGLGGYQQRSSLRTWLYQIATNRCRNALRARSRQPPRVEPHTGVAPPEPSRMADVRWLEPYPDALPDGIPDAAPGPEARYERREAASLAFIAALQALTVDQRAVVILREVLGFTAAQTAGMLGIREGSVAARLLRGRAALRRRRDTHAGHPPAPAAGSPAERAVVDKLAAAWEAGDVAGIIALLTDDAWLSMPPMPLAYQGPRRIAAFLTRVAFRDDRRYRLVPARANGQPAFGVYRRDPRSGAGHTTGMLVLTLAGSRICAITRFDSSVFDRFGLPTRSG